MKRRVTGLVPTVVILALLLSGCAVSKQEKPADGKPPESTVQQTVSPVVKSEETAAASEPAETQPNQGTCVHAQWAEEAFPDLSEYERFIHGMDEALPLIYFSTEETVTDFKILSLTLESADDAGNVRFAAEETYSHGTMTPEEPLLARMELMGTIPNNGISYVDGSGKTRYFAVEVSGYDGSLLLTEFTPQS